MTVKLSSNEKKPVCVVCLSVRFLCTSFIHPVRFVLYNKDFEIIAHFLNMRFVALKFLLNLSFIAYLVYCI